MTSSASLGASPMTKLSSEPDRRNKKKLTFKEYFWKLYNIADDTKKYKEDRKNENI